MKHILISTTLIVLAGATSATFAESPSPSKWKATTLVDRMDDSTTDWISVQSVSPLLPSGEYVFFRLACWQRPSGKNQMLVAIATEHHEHTRSTQPTLIRLRFDSAPPIKSSWLANPTQDSFLSTWGTSNELEPILKAKKLLAEVPFSSTLSVVEFDLDGLQQASTPLLRSCPVASPPVAAKPDFKEAGGWASAAGATLSSVQQGAIGDKVRECWTKDAGAFGQEAMTVQLTVTFDAGGVSRSVDVGQADQGRMGDPRFHAFVERARRAVLTPRCANLPIPASDLGRVGTITFRFRP